MTISGHKRRRRGVVNIDLEQLLFFLQKVLDKSSRVTAACLDSNDTRRKNVDRILIMPTEDKKGGNNPQEQRYI